MLYHLRMSNLNFHKFSNIRKEQRQKKQILFSRSFHSVTLRLYRLKSKILHNAQRVLLSDEVRSTLHSIGGKYYSIAFTEWSHFRISIIYRLQSNYRVT